MSKPSWERAPQWAVSLAQDANGDWCFYSKEPQALIEQGQWGMRNPPVINTEKYVISERGSKNPDWANTLESRP